MAVLQINQIQNLMILSLQFLIGYIYAAACEKNSGFAHKFVNVLGFHCTVCKL